MVGPNEVKEAAMGEVVAIDRGRFLRYYVPRSHFQTIVEEALFVLGVLGTIVVPQVIYCATGGPVLPWLFIVSAQTGVIVGLVKYIRPATFASIGTLAAPVARDGSTRRRKLS
jgi:hypothetical protein